MKIKRILVLTINHYDDYLHAKQPYHILPYPSQDANIFSGLIVEQVFTIFSLYVSHFLFNSILLKCKIDLNGRKCKNIYDIHTCPS